MNAVTLACLSAGQGYGIARGFMLLLRWQDALCSSPILLRISNHE